jgi:hypothetical protein
MFEQNLELDGAYCHHIWETTTWDPYLKNLTVDDIMNIDTTFNKIARRFLK